MCIPIGKHVCSYCMYVLIHAEVSGQSQVPFPKYCTPCFLRLSLICLKFMDKLDFLVIEPQGYSYLCLLDAGMTSMHHVLLHRT